MTVGIKVGSIIDEIGASDFLHAFFSTVSGNLENRWGARFPTVLISLYRGILQPADASRAISEIAEIRLDLARLGPGNIIWDIDDRARRPPWDSNLSSDITDLSNYFVTSTGRDLIDVLQEALEAARDEGKPAEIVTY